MSENMQFPIPNSVLEPFIKQAVATAITSALGDGVKLVEMAVHSALAQKVNSRGVVSNSSYENSFVLADVVAKNAIQEIARETIKEMAETMRPRIKEQIEKELKNKHTLLAQTLVDGAIESLKSSWSVSIHMQERR